MSANLLFTRVVVIIIVGIIAIIVYFLNRPVAMPTNERIGEYVIATVGAPNDFPGGFINSHNMEYPFACLWNLVYRV
jgi:hypothetical protein